MAQRSGSADLPLHGGRVPEWLASRMAQLGRVICEAIVLHYGRQELLRRFAPQAHPQSDAIRRLTLSRSP